MQQVDFQDLQRLIEKYGVAGVLKAAAALVALERGARQRTIEHLLDAAYDLEGAREGERPRVQLS
jgi:hypothetical protein